MSSRETAVAGQFYPASSDEIEVMIKHYNEILDKYLKDKSSLDIIPRALIVPHAGYIYSGFTANFALKLLANINNKNVVVIGPSHRVGFRGTSISEYESFKTPFGDLNINQELLKELKTKFDLNFYPEAHHEHSTEVQMPFIKKYEKDVSVVELVYSEENPAKLSEVIDYLLTKDDTVVVISSDLSHFYKLEEAKQLDSICMSAIEELDVAKLHQGCEACGKIGVEAMLLSAKKLHLEPTLLDYRTSADTSKDESSVVGYVSVAFTQKKTDDKKEVLLKLARGSVKEAVGLKSDVDIENILNENRWLADQGASFVTLTTEGEELRGCIGSIISHQELYKDILNNARSAALNDPRFKPLTKEEYEGINVEVSLLTEPKLLEYENIVDLKAKIRVGVDGVVLRYQHYQSTFLPQVWEQLPSFEEFFSHLCQKAGMKGDCLVNKPDIYVYQVEKFKEE